MFPGLTEPGVATRFGMFPPGRCTPRPLPICAFPCGDTVLPALRPEFRATFAATGDAVWNEPRPPAGGTTWLTTGRAKERAGGAAADLAFAPSMVVRVGLASTVCNGVTRLN
jgi:hypothetical protein